MAALGAHAQLNWEGQGGVFINPLAYPTAAGKIEGAIHHIDLNGLRTIQTFGVSAGLKGGLGVGFSHIASSVDGVHDQSVVPLKWQFAKEGKDAPALAATIVFRDLTGHGSATDYGLTGTKVVTLGSTPIVVSAGGRATKALGVGLFGINDAYQFRWEGAIAAFVTPRFIVGAEIKQQSWQALRRGTEMDTCGSTSWWFLGGSTRSREVRCTCVCTHVPRHSGVGLGDVGRRQSTDLTCTSRRMSYHGAQFRQHSTPTRPLSGRKPEPAR